MECCTPTHFKLDIKGETIFKDFFLQILEILYLSPTLVYILRFNNMPSVECRGKLNLYYHTDFEILRINFLKKVF